VSIIIYLIPLHYVLIEDDRLSASNERNGFVVFDGVSKRYGSLLALNDVSFAIQEGEIFGYIGPNGAGKTTTIKIMVGLLKSTQGKLHIGDHQMPEEKGEVYKMLGYLPQNVAFQDWRTVNHALTTFGKLSGLNKNEIEDRIKKVLELVALPDVRNKKIVELSGGMTQKLGLAQALLHDPKLLVLDEPLSGLDPESRYEVKQVIKKLGKSGTTVFFSSHILSDVQDVATKIGILNFGRIMQIGTLDELKSAFPISHVVNVMLSHDSGRCRELKSLRGVTDVEQPANNSLLVHLDREADVDETIHQLIKSLLNLGCRIRSITPVFPTLDEVYLQYIRRGEHS
jgi:ABC-2 type transport system ATP-binding protein